MKNNQLVYLSTCAALAILLLPLSGLTVASMVAPIIQAQAGPAPTPSTNDSMTQTTHAKLSPSDKAEIRIKDLHKKLKITPDQETQWQAVAQVIRDNAATMEDLASKREANASGMTAVEDLKSYEEIAQAHVDGLKSFIPAFETLYNAMSDEQKKTTDKLFGHSHGGGVKKWPKSK